MANAKILLFTDNEKRGNRLAEGVKSSDWSTKLMDYNSLGTLLSLEGPDCVIFHSDDNIEEKVSSYINEVRAVDDNLPVIVISEKGSIEDAVKVMKEGAYEFFTNPKEVEKISISIFHAIRLYNLTKKIYLLEQRAGWQGMFDDMIGHSAKMQEIFQLIKTVAKSNATVLILGESGTGKELVAKAIHRYSKRLKKSFIDINCGAIPRELLENELFGHEKGAYTGADRLYIGSCERAHQGTLFLDEICEMDPLLQVKLLRLLQDRSFNRVGGLEKIVADIRFIAATNREIEQEVKEGKFREDLFYRLNVVPIVVPPLRDRKEDILPIAKFFLERYSEKNEKIFVDVASDAAEALIKYDWPGNVRELENVIERIVVLNNDSSVKLKHLPAKIQEAKPERKGRGVPTTSFAASDGQKIIPLELVEKYAIETALDKCDGNVSEAARQLKIGQATLYRKIKQYGLRTK